MKLRTVLAAAGVLAMSAVCVRLGFWQIDRLHQKRRLNAETAASLAAPALDLGGEPGRYEAVRGRRVHLRGRFDETRQVLLSGRSHAGSPGVEVVTPLVLAGERAAILVDRGWLYAPDAASARPQDCPEPGERELTGLPFEPRRGAGGPPLRSLAGGPPALWSARWLDLDSLAGRFPYPLASYALRELPGPGVPDRPLRSPPRPLDEWTHISYAAQWFLFATILLGGSAALAWSRRRPGGPPAGARAGKISPADPGLSRRG